MNIDSGNNMFENKKTNVGLELGSGKRGDGDRKSRGHAFSADPLLE